MRSFAIAALVAAVVAGCEKKPELLLVPVGEVKVYSDSEGRHFIGTSAQPLEVIGFRYPDKTDYVVEVRFNGADGFVKSGAFQLKSRNDLDRKARGTGR